MTNSGVVTVADLLKRYAPGPAKAPTGENTPTVSVGSLLRREGQAPHALDRPIHPRAHQQSGAAAVEPGRRRARGTAIAAGALLAAGSVFGAAVLTGASSNTTDARGGAVDGTYPGQGLLDRSDAAPAAAAPTVINPAAASDPLNPGLAAMSWAPVGLPIDLPAAPNALAAPGSPAPAPAASGAGAPSGVVGTPPAGGAAPSAGDSGPVAPDGSTAPSGGLAEGVESTLNDVGATLPAPVGEPVQDLGSIVGKAGATLDTATAPATSRPAPQSASAPSTDPALSTLDQGTLDQGAPRATTVRRSPQPTGLLGSVGKVAGGLLG